ncbi:MAG: serine/threonine-protein kinase [Candidatus Eisenbacteria bacterium]
MTAPSLDEVAAALCVSRGFTLVRPAGGGAFKRTYLVHRPGASEAALKIYPHDASDERSQREIEAMVRCSHPNIARLFESSTFVHDGLSHMYTLEEFVAGGTLTQRMADRGLMSPVELKNLGAALIAALSDIASNDLVHRDLKPDNIMLRDDTSPVIVDFGLVRTLNRTSLTPSWQPTGPGTPWFSAPEQLNNEKQLIDWRTDQFSLGVLLAHCLLNRHPYAVSGDTPSQTIERVATRDSLDAEFVSEVRAAALDQILRMVAPWPVQRYRTTSDLAKAWGR